MGPSRDGVEPTVLLVGAGERLKPAFQAALSRHQVQVETTELPGVVNAVIVTAPDLVLLMGEAAKDGGASVLTKLAGLSQNFTVPVVVLSDDAELEAKLSAFRHGATAVLPRSASIDATAERVARMAREIPEQGTDSQGAVGDATLDAFISVLSKELRSGLVNSLAVAGSEPQDLKLTLGRGRPLTEFIDTFVRRVRRHVVRAEPLRYELGGTQPVDAHGAPRSNSTAPSRALEGLRVVLADDDTPRADAVAQELRKRGVTVVVTDLAPNPTRFQTLRQADPTVFVIGEEHANGAGYELLRRLRRDSRLRWASLLVVRWDEIWAEERGAPSLGRLESTLAGLVEPERALLARAEARAPFDTRLETTGPARCLRVLETSPRPLRVRVDDPHVEITLDLSDGLVVGAEGHTFELESRVFSGVSALSALLVLGSGRVRVEPVDQPASANVMTPVEAALTMADAETPPIAPSIPAAGTVSLQPAGVPDTAPLSAPVGSIRPVAIVSVAPALAPPRPAPLRSAPRQALVSVPRPPARPLGPPVCVEPASPRPQPEPAPVMPDPFPRVETIATVPIRAAAPLVPPAPLHATPPLTSAPSTTSVRPQEHNPPAMTLSAPDAPTAALAPHPPQTRKYPVRAQFRALAEWFARQDAKLHGKRISFGMTAVLVALGALQGALVVTLYAGARWLTRPRMALARSAAAPEPAQASALASAALAPPAPAASAASPSAVPKASSAAPAAAASAPPVTPAHGDGSGRSVPDCKTLLAAELPRPGFYPEAAQQQERLGRAAIVHGDLAAAQTALCRAAAWNSGSADIEYELALVLLLERDGPQALGFARRAVDLEPNSTAAREALGDALARTGSAPQAQKAFLTAAHVEAADERGVRALIARSMKQGDYALSRGDFESAERGFRRATVLEPTSSSAACGLSYALCALGDAGAGVLWARRAVELAPRSSTARLALGDALAKSGDRAAAASEWREAVLLDPHNRQAQRRLRASGPPPT